MENIVIRPLEKFIAATLALHEGSATPLLTEYLEEISSPCYLQSGKNGDMVPWQPCKQTHSATFANVEKALELTLNEQYCHYFTTYWSDNLLAVAEQGNCELLQVMSTSDFERLQENLIGHLLMKQRLKQPPTLFFALTDEDDFILSVDNASGEVVLEQVGKLPSQLIAPDLASFIETLTPRLS
jgi:SecY interacting protein Syd